MEKYPEWEKVSENLKLLPKGMLNVLRKALSFIVMENGKEHTAVIFRAAPSEFRGRVTPDTPVRLHMDYFHGRSADIFTLYPLIFDDPADPFFKEHFIAPYDDKPGLQVSDPYSFESRKKLELLFSQDYVQLLAVNDSDAIQFTRKVPFSRNQLRTFKKYKKELAKYYGKLITTPQFLSIIQESINAVPMSTLKRKFLSIK